MAKIKKRALHQPHGLKVKERNKAGHHGFSNIFDDTLAFDLIALILHGPLRKIYFDFLKGTRQKDVHLHTAYMRLLQVSGAKRAKALRANKELFEYYSLRTQRV